jgi:hypothetical protein
MGAVWRKHPATCRPNPFQHPTSWSCYYGSSDILLIIEAEIWRVKLERENSFEEGIAIVKADAKSLLHSPSGNRVLILFSPEPCREEKEMIRHAKSSS